GVLYKSGIQPVKCLPFHGCGTINKTGVKDKKFRSICQVKNENFYFTFSKTIDITGVSGVLCGLM
ncbi:MAG: hypothetical protein PHT26_16245, partial [Lentimicrobiaceae bacterium]|nr:hypothetical protein [Lentimicrobiaceae bacterium]